MSNTTSKYLSMKTYKKQKKKIKLRHHKCGNNETNAFNYEVLVVVKDTRIIT